MSYVRACLPLFQKLAGAATGPRKDALHGLHPGHGSREGSRGVPNGQCCIAGPGASKLRPLVSFVAAERAW